MDPDKVTSIINWKVPTNKDLLAGFLGAIGYLASGCHDVRILMGCLSKLTGSTSPWQWTHTEQRTFDEVQVTVEHWRNVRCVNLDYSLTAHPLT